jgi:hypothetical protein
LTKDLYTTKDVEVVRNQMLEAQKGVDPITKEPIKVNQAVLDHCHDSQKVRAAISRQSNSWEGLVFNAYKRCMAWYTDKPLAELLRNLADYLEQDYSNNPHHPGWLKKVGTEFNKLSEGAKDRALINLGSAVGKNSKERKVLFGKVIKSKRFTFKEILEMLKNTEL